jgi:hypothetical protein
VNGFLTALGYVFEYGSKKNSTVWTFMDGLLKVELSSVSQVRETTFPLDLEQG